MPRPLGPATLDPQTRYRFRGHPPESAVLLRIDALMAVTGLSKSQIAKLVADGDMPRPRKISPNGRAVAWVYAEIKEWAAALEPTERHEPKLEDAE